IPTDSAVDDGDGAVKDREPPASRGIVATDGAIDDRDGAVKDSEPPALRGMIATDRTRTARHRAANSGETATDEGVIAAQGAPSEGQPATTQETATSIARKKEVEGGRRRASTDGQVLHRQSSRRGHMHEAKGGGPISGATLDGGAIPVKCDGR